MMYQDHDIALSVVVGHVHDDGVGLKFGSLKGDLRTKLEGLMESLIADRKFIPEKVRARRTQVEVRALIEYASDMSSVLLRNISASGAFVESGVFPRVQSEIGIFVPFVDGIEVQGGSPRVVSARATVIHHREHGFGCCFVDPSPEFRKAVFDLMSSE